jgi:hypothetical protein
MLNILWIEDEFTEQKKISWFNDRNVIIKTNFLEGKEEINKGLEQFDLVVLDINLENTEHSNEITELANQFGISEQEFLQESGMNLFLNLLEHGFPKEQIIFLTANADKDMILVDELHKAFEQKDDDAFDETLAEIQNGLGELQIVECAKLLESDDIDKLFQYLESYYESLTLDFPKNTYNRFCEAYKRCRITPPKAINKNLNDAKKYLNNWLQDHESNDYLILRRGVIEGCNFLKNHVSTNDDNIQLRDFIKLEGNEPSIEIESSDIINYLDALSRFFAIKEDNCAVQYRLFLRILAHEWEENVDAQSFKAKNPKAIEKVKDIYTFGWIMKMTRNWVSHANLLDPLDTEAIAFLFLVNMRAMFRLPKEIQSYEKILLNCISASSVNFTLEELTKSIDDCEFHVDCVLEGLRIKLQGSFGEKINAIYRRNTGNPDAEEHDFKQFLFQYFWVNQRYNGDLMEKNKEYLAEDKFLPVLASRIYHRSFAND